MKVKVLGVSAALLLTLAACDQLGLGDKEGETEGSSSDLSLNPGVSKPRKGTSSFVCDDGRSFTVKFQKKSAEVTLSGGTLTLQPMFVASGTKHTDGFVTLWTKGEEAFIEQGGQSYYANCKIKT